MKAFWHLVGTAILLISLGNTARAQILNSNSVIDGADSVATPFSSVFDAGNWFPGRMWLEVNLANRGFGYEAPYATIGGKSRLAQDVLDGRWQGELNLSVESEAASFFYNVGVERVFTIDAAGADVTLGVWYDEDHFNQGNFGHTMRQIAVNASVETETIEVVGNGFLPIGTASYSQGDPSTDVSFFANRLLLQPGIDSALQGFDTTLILRPERFAPFGGAFEFGGYQYSSEIIEAFAGARLGTSFIVGGFATIGGEVSYDDRFDTSGAITMSFNFGGRGADQDYGATGNDLVKTKRPEHITRVQQDLLLAIDPDTGLPYNVLHVDNSVGPGGNGFFNSRFDTLADAEAASAPDDIIFVHNGDGTTTGYDTGIVLKLRQQLLGDGVRHVVPTQFGGTILPNDQDGLRATLTNSGGPAVTLASGTVVRGFEISGSGTTMTHGISGTGAIAGGTIENNIISFADGSGVNLVGTPLPGPGITGDWLFRDNVITDSTLDAVNITNATDPTSDFTFISETYSDNNRHGLSMTSYDGTNFIFQDIIATGNFQNGVNLVDFNTTTGPGSFDFLRPFIDSNELDGIHIERADGLFRFRDVVITNNEENGVGLVDVFHSRPTDSVTFSVVDALVKHNHW